MIATISPKARRAVAVGLVMLPLLFACMAAAIPLQQTAAIAATTRGIATKIEHIESQLLLQREQLLARIHELEALANNDPHVLSDETPTIAGAVLSRMLDEMLSRAGGYLTSVQVLEPTLREPLRRIGVRLRVELDIMSLRDFLYEVENHSVLLEVSRLSLQPIANSGPDRLIRAEITIIGYGRLVG